MRDPASRQPCVRSWIFRHRLRLRAIYAPRPSLPAPRARRKRLSLRGPVIVERLGPHTILRASFRPARRTRRRPAA